MKHIISSVILIIGALGLFLTFTKPRYDAIEFTKEEIKTIENALSQVDQFQALTSEKTAKAAEITQGERDMLAKFLPQNIDNVKLIIEMRSLAEVRNLEITNIGIDSNEAPDSANSEEGGGNLSLRDSVGGGQYNEVNMSFNVEASYREFKTLLEDLERSLRLIDIQSITTSQGSEGRLNHSVKFKTYWLGS
jgi:Tfp pilus assembly protein PilO